MLLTLGSAHVRASTSGALSETNCHPWRYGRLMWMHNGQISCFSRIKRRLVAALTEELFLYPQGHTDSEHAFCVFLSHLPNPLRAASFSWRELREAMLKTINSFNTWAKEVDASEPSLMNFVVSDGESVVCTRYINSRTDEAASLYFSSGTSFYEDTPGQYRMVKADKREKIIVVASEPLTFEKGASGIMARSHPFEAHILPPHSGLDSNSDEYARDDHAQDECAPTTHRRRILNSSQRSSTPNPSLCAQERVPAKCSCWTRSCQR
mgnify:CR=1 FL=1